MSKQVRIDKVEFEGEKPLFIPQWKDSYSGWRNFYKRISWDSVGFYAFNSEKEAVDFVTSKGLSVDGPKKAPKKKLSH